MHPTFLLQVFTRETPTWLPHATANKSGGHPILERRIATKKVEDGADRIQTISDSQKRFAAQFSHPATTRNSTATANARMTGGSRWASKPERSKTQPGGSPVGSRWPVNSQARESSRMPLASDRSGTTEVDVRAPSHYSPRALDDGDAPRYRNERGASAGGGGRAVGGSESRANGGQGRDEGAQRQTKSSSGSKSGVGCEKMPLFLIIELLCWIMFATVIRLLFEFHSTFRDDHGVGGVQPLPVRVIIFCLRQSTFLCTSIFQFITCVGCYSSLGPRCSLLLGSMSFRAGL